MLKLLRIDLLLSELCESDAVKIEKWLNSKTLSLGGTTPMKLISANREHKVLCYLEALSNGC